MPLPFCTLSIANAPQPGQRQAQSALIKQREYSHDVAKVTIEYDDSSSAQYAQGNPAALVWGWSSSSANSFVGYVHHAQPQTTAANTSLLDVYLVGASTSLSERSTRVFTNVTIAALVAQFARERNLATVISADAVFSFASLPQMNRTGWALLVWSAQQAGLALTCDKTTLYLQPRRITLNSGVPSFLMRAGRTTVENGVYSFDMRDGASTTNSHTVLTAQGIDDWGNNVGLTSTVNNRDTVARTSATPVARPVTGYAEAVGQIAGQNALERFNIEATATLSGHAYVRPATTVRLDGVGASGSRYWWVSDVEHQISLTDYRLDVVLSADSIPQPTTTSVPLSWSGRPQVVASGAVTHPTKPVPATVFRRDDTREALEALATHAYAGVSSVSSVALSPARALALQQNPVPTRQRGALSSDDNTLPVIVPRYDSWRADFSTKGV